MKPRTARLAALAAALAGGVALTTSLGFWQLRRGAQKEALQAAIVSRARLAPVDQIDLARDAAPAAGQHHRVVRLRGTWVAERTVYLDNRQMDGQPGFFVVTPLRLDAAGDAVLVQRGWIPRHRQDRTRLAPVETPAGPVELSGRIAPPPARLFDFDAESAGPIRQNLDLDRFARETGLALRPLSVLQTDGAADGLARRWAEPAVDVHKHWGYAFQWFALAALITILYAWFQLLRPRIARQRK